MGGDSLSVPILYEANATDFNNLGLGPLVDTTVATVTEERNGQFILEMQYPVDGIRASLIAKNRILKVDAGHKLKDQHFVIKRINRIMGNDGLSYSIYAEHISYITADYALKPNLTVNGSGNVAMTQWLNGIIDSNRIHVDSDITTENTTSWTIDKVQNARQALGGVQGSILDVWGGEYRFDNLNISLLKHRGTVSNTLLSYGRNITDFDQEENITNTYTSIYPFASYSVQNGDTSEQKILTIPDLVVDSEYVKNFPNRKIQVVDFSDKFSTDEKPTVGRLAELAKSYIKNNNVGVPTVSTKISFVDLSKTENYKEFTPLEELDLCDEVPFVFDKFGIKTTAKISRIVWNVLLDSYDSLELGELKTNLSDVINNTNNAALDAKDAANDAKNSADNAALSANGKNRNWYGTDDPAFGHLSELREGDSWYMPNGEDTELYHWINGQWVFILSTKDAHEAKDAADKASKEAEEAKKQANKAVDGANDAVAKAGFANDTATQAKSAAAEAGQQAKDALTNAGTALTNASNALENFNNLNIGGRNLIVRDGELADRMIGTNGQIENYAGSAVTTAIIPIKQGQFLTMSRWGDASDNNFRFAFYDSAGDLIKRDFSSDVTHIVAAPSRSATFRISYPIGLKVKLEYGKFTTDWTAAPQDIQIEITNIDGELKQKVSQVTFDTLKGAVTSQGTLINQNKAEIQLKADLSLVNTIKQTVTNNTATIDLNSKEIKLKASQSDVNKLSGRVTNTESQIKLQADQIALTVSKAELTNILGDYATQTWTQSQIKSTADQINLSVTKVQTNLDNMELGSVNLIIRKDELVNRMIGPTGAIDPFAGSSVTKNIISVEPGKYLTLSRYDSVADNNFRFAFYDSAGAMILRSFDPADTPKVLTVPANAATLRVSYPTGARVKLERGQKGTEYSAAPEDLASEVQFSQLQVTVNGIQGTVQNKADQSQVTQLANQITSVVSDVASFNNAGRNYFLNSNFKDNFVSWSMPTGANPPTIVRSGYYKLGYKVGLHMYGTTTVNYNGFYQNTLQYGVKGDVVYVSFIIVRDGTDPGPLHIGATYKNNAGVTLYTTAKDINLSSIPTSASRQVVSFTYAGATGYDQLEIKFSPYANKPINVWLAELKLEAYQQTPWTPAIEDGATTSQITQLSNMINLRVQKGDVINQINISPESILIAGQKVHITGQTSIDNAVIKDAMIADIKADKITAGTLNAANVNVINLNANNITTGTIKGANLSLNLNTGEVVFQHGRIHSTSNNVDVNIDQGYLSVADSVNRVLLKGGQMQFVAPNLFDNQTNPYLSISNSGGGQGLFGGQIVGRDFLSLANSANNTGFFDNSLGIETFAGISFGKANGTWRPTKIGGADRGIMLVGGASMPSNMFGDSPSIIIGANKNLQTTGNRIVINGEYIHAKSVYEKTSSASANVVVNSDGALVRSTSASKYKTDIIRANATDYGDKLLNLPTATWIDIAETKRYQDNPTTQPKPTRNFGMIAEDLADAGLEMLVVRGTDGELEGINYDRIGPALIPVIAKLKNEVETLKQQLEAETA